MIPLAVVVTVGGLKYTFELQLTTRRASVAADLNHNTVYKNLIGATPAEQRKVSRGFRRGRGDRAARDARRGGAGDGLRGTRKAPTSRRRRRRQPDGHRRARFVLTGSSTLVRRTRTARRSRSTPAGERRPGTAAATAASGRSTTAGRSRRRCPRQVVLDHACRSTTLERRTAAAARSIRCRPSRPTSDRTSPTQYLGQPSASKTLLRAVLGGLQGSTRTSRRSSSTSRFAHASVEYTYRRA